MIVLRRDTLLANYAIELGFEEVDDYAMLFRHDGGGLLINVVGGKEVFYNYESDAGFAIIKGGSARDYDLSVIVEFFKNKTLYKLWS